MARIPSKDEILAWISDNPTQSSKRDIAKAFGIKGADRIDLKRLLRELEDEGHLAKRKKTYRDPDKLPPVAVLEVDAVTDGGEALKLVAKHPYDVVVVDVKMPGIGGAEVLTSIRGSHPALPVILLTGHGGADEGEELLLEEACAYLYKPIKIGELIATMQRCAGDEQDG